MAFVWILRRSDTDIKGMRYRHCRFEGHCSSRANRGGISKGVLLRRDIYENAYR